jgi:hypothetical protein
MKLDLASVDQGEEIPSYQAQHHRAQTEYQDRSDRDRHAVSKQQGFEQP